MQVVRENLVVKQLPTFIRSQLERLQEPPAVVRVWVSVMADPQSPIFSDLSPRDLAWMLLEEAEVMERRHRKQ